MPKKRRLTPNEQIIISELHKLGRTSGLFDLAVVALELDYHLAYDCIDRLARYGLLKVKHHGHGKKIEIEIKEEHEPEYN